MSAAGQDRLPDRLVLLEVGPWSLLAWWRLAPATRAAARRRAGRAARLCLRLQEADPESPGFPLELPVAWRGERWYVDFWRPGHVLTGELGVRDGGGGFRVLARSAPARLPPGGPPAGGPVRLARLGAPGLLEEPPPEAAAWALPASFPEPMAALEPHWLAAVAAPAAGGERPAAAPPEPALPGPVRRAGAEAGLGPAGAFPGAGDAGLPLWIGWPGSAAPAGRLLSGCGLTDETGAGLAPGRGGS